MTKRRALESLPALIALAYLAAAGACGSRIAGSVGWDSDVSAPLVLAERLRGSGTVFLTHFSAWTSLWFELATRGLPGHRELWEAAGYVLAVAGAAIVGWATGRVAGRWAGVTAFAGTLIVGPWALRSLFTLAYHVSTPFGAAVLAAFLVLIEERRARLVAIPVGIFVGVSVASDPLLLPAGVAPFAVAGGVLAWLTRRFEVAIRTGLVLALTAGSALASNAIMHSLGYHVAGAGSHLAPGHDLPGHALLFGRMIALLGGANYALPGGYPREPIRAILACLVLFAAVAPVLAAVLSFLRRRGPLLRAYACYWAAVPVILGISFVVTTNAGELGAGSMNYLLTIAPAAGAGIALLGFGSARARLLVAVGIAIVGVTNVVGVTQGRADTQVGEIGTFERPLVQQLVDKHVTHGYAGYYDAQNLTWQSGMRVFAASVKTCAASNKPLCPYRTSVIASWYREQPGPSFLIVDPENAFLTAPPTFVKDASARYRFGDLTVYVFPYDVARYLGTR
jgi:hypothetical protein